MHWRNCFLWKASILSLWSYSCTMLSSFMKRWSNICAINHIFFGANEIVSPYLAIYYHSHWGQLPSSAGFCRLVENGTRLFNFFQICVLVRYHFAFRLVYIQIEFQEDPFDYVSDSFGVNLIIAKEFYIVCIFKMEWEWWIYWFAVIVIVDRKSWAFSSHKYSKYFSQLYQDLRERCGHKSIQKLVSRATERRLWLQKQSCFVWSSLFCSNKLGVELGLRNEMKWNKI